MKKPTANLINKPVATRVEPGAALYRNVRAEFIRHGSTLNDWCKANGVPLHRASYVLHVVGRDPSVAKLRQRIIDAIGIAA